MKEVEFDGIKLLECISHDSGFCECVVKENMNRLKKKHQNEFFLRTGKTYEEGMRQIRELDQLEEFLLSLESDKIKNEEIN